MEYKFLAERAKYSSQHAGCYSKTLDECANAITGLLARADVAESAREEARQDCAVAERNHMIEVERRQAEKARAEKAEKERDEALDLIGWIYYEACVSVEHDMRPHLDWLKDKIEEWRKNKEK